MPTNKLVDYSSYKHKTTDISKSKEEKDVIIHLDESELKEISDDENSVSDSDSELNKIANELFDQPIMKVFPDDVRYKVINLIKKSRKLANNSNIEELQKAIVSENEFKEVTEWMCNNEDLKQEEINEQIILETENQIKNNMSIYSSYNYMDDVMDNLKKIEGLISNTQMSPPINMKILSPIKKKKSIYKTYKGIKKSSKKESKKKIKKSSKKLSKKESKKKYKKRS